MGNETRSIHDGPASPRFRPLRLDADADMVGLDDLAPAGISAEMVQALEHAPLGACVSWGIPFEINHAVALNARPVELHCEPVKAPWLIFLHTSDARQAEPGPGGFISPMRGQGSLGELAATYTVIYADGEEVRLPIKRRHHVGLFQRRWGENCFEAVAQHKPYPFRAGDEQVHSDWGVSQTRASTGDWARWMNWLWAWENPRPETKIVGFRLEPCSGTVVLSAITAGETSAHPLRWRTRRKAILTLAEGVAFSPDMDDDGLLAQIRLDLGQVISATPRPLYPDGRWPETYNNQTPTISSRDVLIEYTAHADAYFHLADDALISAASVEADSQNGVLAPVAPATQRVNLRVVPAGGGAPVAVKLHIHGMGGEYLAPEDRHRIINFCWFEDYSVDFSHQHTHPATYINGQTTVRLPLGKVYVEVSKGFEIKPVRKVIEVTAETREITIEIEKMLPWRERGWVTADTHVHFLSPVSAMLEGAGEGVNIVNLLASQWGELMTNVGDFDGKTTWGARDAGGEGEYLVRVGTENRQHVLGHISLLGYRGRIISPMTTGGPDESALGDPVDVLLTEWARQCKAQGGVVVLPHFPNPRAEHAASIVQGDIDALEMTSWGDLYSGIDPYSLADWYRYLNCGYLVAAVGGTDKMSANTAVGTVRTYAAIPRDEPFTYDGWLEAVRRAETFVTYGPLIDFAVDGRHMGSRIAMSATGGTVDVTWQAASVTVPMSRVELIVNGEIRESMAVEPWQAAGHWRVPVQRSSWLALLVRGHYADKPEMIAAHSSPVFAEVEGSPMLAAADAVTILEQIEGAMAYLDTVGTRRDDVTYKRMRLVLEGAHRNLHNRMHRLGYYHDHTPVEEHHATR
jgi:hypothetical protein